MLRLGLVGWRGMVGSVLMQRMQDEDDFKGVESTFYTTSQYGHKAPSYGTGPDILDNAFDIKSLFLQDVIISCQGGDYTNKIFPELHKSGWKGFWIDAASSLRMDKDSVIVLDPVNIDIIDKALKNGVKKFIGGNCTVSLMLMALAGLFKRGMVEWMSTMTYQSASGAGAKYMRDLVSQMSAIGLSASDLLKDPASSILDIDRTVLKTLASEDFPVSATSVPIAGSLIPWVDRLVDNGQTREEWKGISETNKILGLNRQVPVDGICVRIGAMRCHSQAFTIKLSRDFPLDEIESIIKESNEWVELIPNKKDQTMSSLTPAAVSGSLRVPVGRLRKMNIGNEFLTGFTVGDQLLWGAAEPLRRMLNIIKAREV